MGLMSRDATNEPARGFRYAACRTIHAQKRTESPCVMHSGRPCMAQSRGSAAQQHARLRTVAYRTTGSERGIAKKFLPRNRASKQAHLIGIISLAAMGAARRNAISLLSFYRNHAGLPSCKTFKLLGITKCPDGLPACVDSIARDGRSYTTIGCLGHVVHDTSELNA